MYDSLAIIYDCFTDDIDYDRWAKDIDEVIRTVSKIPVSTVADLACGTGSITKRLAKLGYRVTGIDISEEMLLRAGDNMRRSGVKFDLVKQDISNFKLHKRSDAIICACDGVNYLTKEGQLKAFIDCCKNALNAGGVLVFDVSSEEKLRGVLGNNDYFDIREDACIFWQNRVNGNMVTMELNIFLKEPDGRYIRKTEEQVQRIYTADEIKKELADFEILDIRSVSYDKNNVDKRLQFVCRLKEI